MARNGIESTASSRYEWPTQSKPNQKICEKWQAALHSTYRLRITLPPSKQTKLGPWIHPGSTVWVYYTYQDHILKKTQGWTAYFPLLIRKGITSHPLFIKKYENYIPSSPTDSLNTKTERVNSCTFKCSGTVLTSSSKHPQVEHQTWLP